MPKTSNYKKEDIIRTALEIVRTEGPDALTARSLSKAVGCSTSPLFTVCGNLEAIREDVRKAAEKEVENYVKDAINYIPAFKEYGMRLIRYAMNEPNLFKLVFLSENSSKDALNPVAMECLSVMKVAYDLTDDEVATLLEQVWTYACGMSMLILSGARRIDEEEVSNRLSRQFASTIMFIKSGVNADKITPRLRKEGEGSTIDIPVRK